MSYNDNQYVSASDLSFTGILHDIKKSKTALQPIFEAFTNALEAIKDKKKVEGDFNGEIRINISSTQDAFGNTLLDSITIRDNGIGFNENEFRRFNTFKDTSKGYKNLGSGRIQYVHHFDRIEFLSHFIDSGIGYERKFTMSKKEPFLKQNSIVLHNHCKETELTETGTSVKFETLLESSNIYNNLNDYSLKAELLKRYISYICHNIDDLPLIEITHHVQGSYQGKSTISADDVPKIDIEDEVDVEYSNVDSAGKSIISTGKIEKFKIDAYKIDSGLLDNNDLKLVSKGEIVEDSGVELESLSKKESVKGFKYLFLISSAYIDSRDTNLRGELNIPTKESIYRNLNLFSGEQIFLEDISHSVNSKIETMYPEIDEVKKEHEVELEKLKAMFLLDDETVKDIKVSINDSQTKILEKFYEAEAKKTAAIDAQIKDSYEKLLELDTSTDGFTEDFQQEVEKLVKAIPLQNKNALTHYVARRKLILELFEKILEKKLKIQIEGDASKGKEEALIHNLLFQQGSENPEESDLWILNEDFIYFKGNSEKTLSNIEINGEKLFKSEFSEEEEKYLTSLGEIEK